MIIENITKGISEEKKNISKKINLNIDYDLLKILLESMRD